MPPFISGLPSSAPTSKASSTPNGYTCLCLPPHPPHLCLPLNPALLLPQGHSLNKCPLLSPCSPGPACHELPSPPCALLLPPTPLHALLAPPHHVTPDSAPITCSSGFAHSRCSSSSQLSRNIVLLMFKGVHPAPSFPLVAAGTGQVHSGAFPGPAELG